MLDKIRIRDEQIIESALDPVHKKLAGDVFVNDKLKPKHREYILAKLKSWLSSQGVKKQPEYVTIVGSITGYQYDKKSDIDVNVVLDISDQEAKKLVKSLGDVNEKPLPGTQHPVNFYVSQSYDDVKKKDGIYDVLENRFVKKPDKHDVSIPYTYLIELARFFMAGLDDRISEYERDSLELQIYKGYLKDGDTQIEPKKLQEMIDEKEREARADLDAIYLAHSLIRGFRNEVFEGGDPFEMLVTIKMPNPDFSVNNLLYKILDRFGYIARMKKYDKIREQYD